MGGWEGGIWDGDTGSFEISFQYFKMAQWEVLGRKREEDLSPSCWVLEKSHLLFGAQVPDR